MRIVLRRRRLEQASRSNFSLQTRIKLSQAAALICRYPNSVDNEWLSAIGEEGTRTRLSCSLGRTSSDRKTTSEQQWKFWVHRPTGSRKNHTSASNIRVANIASAKLCCGSLSLPFLSKRMPFTCSCPELSDPQESLELLGAHLALTVHLPNCQGSCTA